MDSSFENDHFEPETRARSNTWPMRLPDDYAKPIEESATPNSNGGYPASPQPIKKSSHRRNAWGNLSYADLITQAITSSPDGRKTLADIYEWMVSNVPYFRDKGDSNSSAGWKNSVRHNLSLHNRFMRVQNETPGKSSWWMINPDPKPGKTARRRAASMETSKSEKRRERIKKKIEALRNGLPEGTLSPLALEGSPQFDNTGINSEMETLGYSNNSPYGKQLLPIHNEVDMEVEWAKSSSPFPSYKSYKCQNEDYSTEKIKSEIKTEPDTFMDCLAEDQDQKQTVLPPFSTAYEINLNLLQRNPMHSYTQYSSYLLENYRQCKTEKISPPRSPMFSQQPPSVTDSNPLLRERLLDTSSQSPPFTAMGQFIEALNQNTFVDSFQQNMGPIQGGYDNTGTIGEGFKQELDIDENLDVQNNLSHAPQKSSELGTTNTPLESIFINQYRNYVLT